MDFKDLTKRVDNLLLTQIAVPSFLLTRSVVVIASHERIHPK